MNDHKFMFTEGITNMSLFREGTPIEVFEKNASCDYIPSFPENDWWLNNHQKPALTIIKVPVGADFEVYVQKNNHTGTMRTIVRFSFLNNELATIAFPEIIKHEKVKKAKRILTNPESVIHAQAEIIYAQMKLEKLVDLM